MDQLQNSPARFASHIAMILSQELDRRESEFVGDRVVDLSECLIGGRKAHAYEPELKLLGALLYFGCSLFAYGSTPGQQFCGLALVEPHSGVRSEGGSFSAWATEAWRHAYIRWGWGADGKAARDGRVFFTRPSVQSYALVAALLALGPYCASRLKEATSALAHLWAVVSAPEPLSPPGRPLRP